MAKEDDIFKIKADWLDDREIILKRKVSTAERKLFNLIVEGFLDKVDTTDGKVDATGKNIRLTQEIDQLFEEFQRTTTANLIDGYLSDITRATKLNEKYFKLIDPGNKKFAPIRDNANRLALQRLGLTPKGNVIKDGFLDNFIKDNRIKNQVKEAVTKGITGGSSFRQLKQDVDIILTGAGETQGALQAQYRTFIYDTYQQIDRLTSSEYATQMKLKAFLYQGGKINTTRKFCCQRDGLVFTVDEAERWRNLRFDGKNKNYNPLVDLGGYNCRHHIRYLSNFKAAQMRDDLIVNDKGELIHKPGAKKQKLNSGCN